ncbi:MAG: RidA family protein [Actinomycetota bacterium]
MSHEDRLREAGIVLPAPMTPAGLYVGAVLVGELLHVSGQGPVDGDRIVTGKVGDAVTVEEAREAARLTGLQLLATVRAELGTLDRVVRPVKLFGMVNCAPGFNRTPQVIDGCSELFHQAFGPAGGHARSAVGMAELPFDIAVEIEAVFQFA